MKPKFRARTVVKSLIVAAFVGGAAIFFAASERPNVRASALGPSPSFTNAPGENNCTACHTTNPVNSGDGRVQILGLPTAYAPGQQIDVTVRINKDDAVIYGFQLTAIDGAGNTVGTFTLPQEGVARMQIIPNNLGDNSRQYVEHTIDGLTGTSFGFNTWTFTWTAPAQSGGPVSFFAAGNAANGDGSPSEDYIYTASAVISPAASSISISGRVTSDDGRGIRGANVRLTDAQGVSVNVQTSTLGYYTFQNVAAGRPYSLTALSKRFRFASRPITPDQDLTDIDLVGQE